MPHQESKPGYLSVTEILSLSIPKPFLNYWYGRLGTAECERIKKSSQVLGTSFHSEVEDRFINKKWLRHANDNIHRMSELFWGQFVIPYEAKPIALEESLSDIKLKFQGTYDAVIDTNKGRFIADWKTSNSLDPVTIPLQLCAYGYLYNKKHKTFLNQGMAVRIDKEKDKVQVKEYANLDALWPVFKACIKVARYQQFGEV